MMGGASAKNLDVSTPQTVHRYIMFLPGVCAYPHSDPYCYGRVSAANRARATFRSLIGAMAVAKIRYVPLYYSYNALHPDYYSVAETHRSAAQSISALEQQLAHVRASDHQATFVLVSHSLGGVVAAGWAAVAAQPGSPAGPATIRSRVHSIVTFDSPVRGLPSLYTSTLAAQIFGGAVLSSLRPNSPIIRQILSFSDSWWRTTGHLHTVANRADIIVPAARAILGFSRVVNDTTCGRDLFLIRSCHGAVLSDASLNAWVACHWITDARQCQVRPTPTLRPSPTLSPTPTSTVPSQETPTSIATPPTTPPLPRMQRTGP